MTGRSPAAFNRPDSPVERAPTRLECALSRNGDSAIMKLLFTAGGGPAAVFGAAPLPPAAPNAGQDILLPPDEPLLDTAEAIGLPAVSISADLLRHGHELAMASARLEAMVDLAEAWS